jgi:hypothetical protein
MNVPTKTSTKHAARLAGRGRPRSSTRSSPEHEITDAELAAADRYEQLAAHKRIAAMLASGKQAWLYVDGRSATEAS